MKQKVQPQKIRNQSRNRQADSIDMAAKTKVTVTGGQHNPSAKIRQKNAKDTTKSPNREHGGHFPAEEPSENNQKSP